MEGGNLQECLECRCADADGWECGRIVYTGAAGGPGPRESRARGARRCRPCHCTPFPAETLFGNSSTLIPHLRLSSAPAPRPRRPRASRPRTPRAAARRSRTACTSPRPSPSAASRARARPSWQTRPGRYPAIQLVASAHSALPFGCIASRFHAATARSGEECIGPLLWQSRHSTQTPPMQIGRRSFLLPQSGHGTGFFLALIPPCLSSSRW